MTYTKTFHEDKTFGSWANTLQPEDLGFHSESGWTIEGEVHEDWYEWVNFFTATHPVYGKIEGDFEDTVTAETHEAFEHFYKHHPPTEWDYWDI